MATHIFEDNLNFEQSKFELQNKFYRKILKVEEIERIDYNKSKELQKNDIDVILTKKNKKYTFSEKHRNIDFDDLLIELYSKFPTTTGWITHSKADYLAYFVPQKVYILKMQPLVDFYKNYLKSDILYHSLEKQVQDYPQKSHRQKITLNINNQKEQFTLVQAYNKPEPNTEWYTESICCQFDFLEKIGIKIWKYSLQSQ